MPTSNSDATTPRGRLAPGHLPRALLVLTVFVASYFLALAGVYLAQYYLEKGPSFIPLTTIQDGFVRWDSLVYRDIVEGGYSYDGDPCLETNIVFMPAFPLATRALAGATGLGTQSAGLWVVRVCFLAALFVLYLWISDRFGTRAALFVLLGLCFSPGTFAFHSYYSESVMLLFLALSLYFQHRGQDGWLSLSSFVLGATRVTVAPFAVLIALGFLYRAVQTVRRRQAGAPLPVVPVLRLVALACVSVGGLFLYLAFIAREFGNPFELIPAIKYCAWDKSHIEMGLLELVTLSPLWGHIGAAIERPYFFVLDVKSTNLIWTLLALASIAYSLLRRRFDLLTLGFASYVLLTFYANGKAEWLESSYRHYAPVLPIYLMAHDAFGYLRARLPDELVTGIFLALLSINVMYMVLYMALFTSGRWHFF